MKSTFTLVILDGIPNVRSFKETVQSTIKWPWKLKSCNNKLAPFTSSAASATKEKLIKLLFPV